MTQAFRIAPHLVVRDEDTALFDGQRFNILQFNRRGYDLITPLLSRALTHAEWGEYACANGISKADFQVFIQKCVQHGIIVEVESERLVAGCESCCFQRSPTTA